MAHLDTDADRNAVRIASKTPAIPVKTKEYAFDAVFDAQSTNEQVYRNVFLRSGKSSEDANVVETILRGGIATVFAYGATGSGKTHTMIGRKEDPGMMMRSIRDVFDGVERMNEKRKTRRGERSREEGGEEEEEQEEGTLEVRCSYVEVYNENLYDLLAEITIRTWL